MNAKRTEALDVGRDGFGADVSSEACEIAALRFPDAGEGCEWVDVEGETLNLTHAEADDWLER